MLDAHFHLDLFKDYRQILADISKSNMFVIAVTNSPSVFHFTNAISKENTKILPAVGLHPELVGKRSGEMALLLEKIREEKFIGEVGLDYSSKFSKQDRALQRKAFEQIINECELRKGKILSIHSRRATSDVISIVGKDFPGTIILHWFSGGITDLQRAVDFGYYFSINPAMVKSKSGQNIISKIPPEQVLTETDGPFVETDNRPAIPSDVDLVIQSLSNVWGIEKELAMGILEENAKKGGILL